MSYLRQLPNQRSSFGLCKFNKCVDCGTLTENLRCGTCHLKYIVKKSQAILLVNRAFCPRCGMSLGEHKDTELKLCLFNLRGILASQKLSEVAEN